LFANNAAQFPYSNERSFDCAPGAAIPLPIPARFIKLFTAVVALFRNCAAGPPTVLILDDLHRWTRARLRF